MYNRELRESGECFIMERYTCMPKGGGSQICKLVESRRYHVLPVRGLDDHVVTNQTKEMGTMTICDTAETIPDFADFPFQALENINDEHVLR